MIPARDRQLRLTIYNTQADMEADTNGTNITSGIYESSANLEHTFFTVLPGWGEANASMFTCDLADAPDLTGKYIRVWVLAYATEAATTRTSYRVFAGRIDSCRYDKYKASRALEAYDRLYELRKVDISEWWNTWVQSQTASTFTLAAALNAMCTQYGVTNNASLPGYGTGTAPMKARKLGACSFVQMLNYIGEICGGYFSMQDGTLRFVDMRNVNGTAAQESADGNLDTQLTEIDDADTAPYTQVTIYEGSDIVYSNGSGKNLAITDNPFLTGQTPATINSWGVNIYANVTRMAGRPATLALAYSQPQAEWSRITSAVPFILTTTDEGTTRRHIVSGYSFSGSGLIDETISCTGEMREGASYSAQQNAMLSELTDLGTQLTFKVNADAVIEAVNLEAQGGVTINAEAIDINGVVSANNWFKINTDGSMETIAGKIGGWEIDADKLTKTDLETDPNTQQVIHDYSLALSPHEKVLSGTSNVSTEEVNKGSIDVYAWGTIIKKGETLNQMVYSKASFVQPVTTEYNNSIEISRKVKQRSGGDGEWHDYGKSIVDRTGLEVYTGQIDPYANQPVKTAQVNSSGLQTYNTSGTELSRLTNTELKINTHDLLRMTPHLAQMFATAISANADLNTETYLAVGQYFCAANATAQTYTNCPTTYAFTMIVEAPISSAYDEESGVNFYRVRTITDHYGNVWNQSAVRSGSTVTYRSWQREIRSTEFTEVTSGTIRKATTTTLSDTDVSITIPTAGYWIFFATMNYNNARPQQIAVCALSGNYIQQKAFSEAQTYDKTVAQITATGMYYFAANTVLKIYAKCATAHATGNDIFIYAKKIP